MASGWLRTVEGLDTQPVVLVQLEAIGVVVGIEGVHDGSLHRSVARAQGVAYLVNGHAEQADVWAEGQRTRQ